MKGIVSLLKERFRQIHGLYYGSTPGQAQLLNAIEELKLQNSYGSVQKVKSLGMGEELESAEFKVFSQFGEDGIIQYLIHNLAISNEEEQFVEFGVQDYHESNTRFLLQNNNWDGLVFDGDSNNIAAITSDPISWRYNLTAQHAFIDAENINDLLNQQGLTGSIGLLSIDIDGNDYWVWKSITAIQPIILIAEYNSRFGKDRAVTIPYQASFQRRTAHYSNLYWGCSLKALCLLAKEKGYTFIGSNSNANNAFFIRNDKVNGLKSLSCEEGYRHAKFRESRDQKGNLTFLSPNEGLALIQNLKLLDLERNESLSIKELGLLDI